MANEKQVKILKQGIKVWNEWREINYYEEIDLCGALLDNKDLENANLNRANLKGAFLRGSSLKGAHLVGADLENVKLWEADLGFADLSDANMSNAELMFSMFNEAVLSYTNLGGANLRDANLKVAHLWKVNLKECNFLRAKVSETSFGNLDLSQAIGLDKVAHFGPSSISIDTFSRSKGKIPEIFLRGCGLSDWEIESAKLYNPELNNEEINQVLYKIYDLRASQALQISPLFISYSHEDSAFVDKLENQLNKKGIRFWRDVHDAAAGRLEKQIDRAIRQNPTVLLILSKHSLISDWVEHEVRTARELEKEMGNDVLCPVALDDSWKNSPWPKRIMEQVLEYNILDFSEWEDDSKFKRMFRKLIDGLELFYKG